MIPEYDIRHTLTGFWEKHRAQVLALLLAVYSLPATFYNNINYGLDGSWIKAINYAVKNKLVFGTQFVFTFGPLGFLSTRNTQYISPWLLLLADLFLAFCFFWFIRRFLSIYKKWALILLVAIFYFKGAEYAQALFFFFILFAFSSLSNNFSNYTELVCCAIAGTVVFFIKINYGIIAIPVLLSLFIISYTVHKRGFLLLAGISAAVFITIYSLVHINLAGYIRYGLPLIGNYPEAMGTEAIHGKYTVQYGVAFVILYAGLLGCYIWQLRRSGAFNWVKVYAAALAAFAFFLLYKNGFTRAEDHTPAFFLMMPLLVTFSMLLFGFGSSCAARAVCIAAIIMADLNIPLVQWGIGRPNVYKETITSVVGYATTGSVTNYFGTLLKNSAFDVNPAFILPKDKKKLVGRSPIDIIPTNISLLLQNGLNYDPRPVIQSYSAYSPVLDSLNAAHFYKKDRPGFVLITSLSINDRYPQWDESVTKAVLHLNYDCIGFISLHNDSINNGTAYGDYSILRSKAGVQQYPRFEKLYEQTVNFEDTVNINFPDNAAVYMTADINYNIAGKMRCLLFQPPMLYADLIFNPCCDTALQNRVMMRTRIIRPSMQEPELISKAIRGNLDFKNFITGNLAGDASVSAFVLHAKGSSCEKKVRLVFYRFSNY